MKKKNLLVGLLSTLFIGISMLAMSSCEDYFSTKGIKYSVSEDGTYAEVVGYEGTATEIRIADAYKEFPVKTICEKAFFGDGNIVSVIIPDSVTTIGDYAFKNCKGLTSVKIGETVTLIGKQAFYSCRNLISVDISDSVTSIGDKAFAFCDGLTSVVIGDSVTTIDVCAFYSCDNLSNVEIPDSVVTIADCAFSGCDGLKAIKVSEKNTVYKDIDGNLYSKDGSVLIQYVAGVDVTEFIIPNSVASIADYAFRECSTLTSVVIPDSVTSIGNYAFFECENLVSVAFENPQGWWCSSVSSATSGTSVSNIDLSDKTKATEYLKSTYLECYWHRG